MIKEIIKQIATRNILRPLTKKQRKQLAEFCFAMQQIIDEHCNKPDWFCGYVGVCSNFKHFHDCKDIGWSLYTHFKKSFPFGYTRNCDYKNPLRRAFIQHWAQKHLDYIAKKH